MRIPVGCHPQLTWIRQGMLKALSVSAFGSMLCRLTLIAGGSCIRELSFSLPNCLDQGCWQVCRSALTTFYCATWRLPLTYVTNVCCLALADCTGCNTTGDMALAQRSSTMAASRRTCGLSAAPKPVCRAPLVVRSVQLISGSKASCSSRAAVVARAASTKEQEAQARWTQQVKDGTVMNVSNKTAGAAGRARTDEVGITVEGGQGCSLSVNISRNTGQWPPLVCTSYLSTVLVYD